MITKLRDFMLLEKSKLVPRNLNGRAEKLRQQNLMLLQQETIESDFFIDDSLDFAPDQVKVKQINGFVTVRDITTGKIPQWLQNVTVNGSFNCSYNQLTSLDGCPKTINGNFICANNQLTSLEGCPQTVGRSFSCASNQLTSLEGCSKTIGNDFYCSYNQLTSLEGCPTVIERDFYCSNNFKKFTQEDVPKETIIKGKFFS